jgi:hypothetical protein
LALVAALSFVLNTASHADHHLPASDGHFHAVGHDAANAPDHRLVADAESAAHHDHTAPSPAADSDANCCACTCGPAIALPSLHAHAVPCVMIRTVAVANHHPGDGIVAEGPRRPPRPLSTA